jgi:hypothetical protein
MNLTARCEYVVQYRRLPAFLSEAKRGDECSMQTRTILNRQTHGERLIIDIDLAPAFAVILSQGLSYAWLHQLVNFITCMAPKATREY